MPLTDLAANLLSPSILFFALGLFAAFAKSDLELPAPAPKILSLVLLFCLGLKGGVSLAQSGLTLTVAAPLIAGMIASVAIPLWAFFLLKKRLGPADAAGVAATYGSVSAVTFIAACAFLTDRAIPFSGHMVAAMALMESPAIIIGVLLARRFAVPSSATPDAAPSSRIDWAHLGRDAFLNGSVLLLLGSLAIGFIAGPTRSAPLKPFVEGLFPALLALFLLDLGIVAGRRLGQLRASGRAAFFALLAPPVNASLGLGLAALFQLNHGDAFLLVVLCASASYIAVPAALRVALPEANPALYVTWSLALTFPFNLIFGLPLYDLAVTQLL